MKGTKMILIRIAFICMLAIILFCSTAYADDSETFEVGDYLCSLQDDGTIKIEQFMANNHVTRLVVPSELDGKTVTAIAGRAFSICDYLKEITIPDSLITLDSNPFTDYCHIEHINISPEHPTLEIIDGALFSKPDKRLICYPNKLSESEYTIPYGIEIISNYAFFSCENLSKISIPESVTTIGANAFYLCGGLTEISIPRSVTYIGVMAFESCYRLTDVYFQDEMITLGGNPFVACSSLERIHIPSNHPSLALVDGVLFSTPDNRLVCYPINFSTEEYNIPQGTQLIGDYAFYSSKLKRISFTDSVTAIGDGAFFGCRELEMISLPESIVYIGDYAFAFCETLTKVIVPENVTFIGNESFYCCRNLTECSIPDSTISIGERAFPYNDSLTFTVTVGNGSYAEQYCIENGYAYRYLTASSDPIIVDLEEYTFVEDDEKKYYDPEKYTESELYRVAIKNSRNLQKAIDDASASNGGIVQIPAGKYYFAPNGIYERNSDYAYVIMCKDNVTLRGEGEEKTILCPLANYKDYADSINNVVKIYKKEINEDEELKIELKEVDERKEISEEEKLKKKVTNRVKICEGYDKKETERDEQR